MNKTYNILIVGFGVVGRNLSRAILPLHPDIYDKYHKEFNSRRDIKYDIAFICVDTPLLSNKQLGIDQIEDAIEENDASIYVIKSTVYVDTIYELAETYPDKRFVYSPEYYGDTPHCNNYEYNFTILGGNIDACKRVQQILQECYDASHVFRITDSRTAELAKLMENSWLATKVTFCIQFYEICKKYDISYEELRELFILDPRVNPSHTFVYEDHPYWDSHCLNKDVQAIATWGDAQFLQGVVKFNNDQKAKYRAYGGVNADTYL